jgi:hypothetical protein
LEDYTKTSQKLKPKGVRAIRPTKHNFSWMEMVTQQNATWMGNEHVSWKQAKRDNLVTFCFELWHPKAQLFEIYLWLLVAIDCY